MNETTETVETYKRKPYAVYKPKEYHINYKKLGMNLKKSDLYKMGILYSPNDLEYPERWDYIKDFECDEITNSFRYLISTYGRIYDTKKGKMVRQTNESKTKNGQYKSCTLRINDDKDLGSKRYAVHRLVAMTFLPEEAYGKDLFPNHKDGIPYHNYPWNLEWLTPSENYIHALRTGLKRELKGEDRYNAKWTENEINYICGLMAEGHKATYIYNDLLEKLDNDPKVQYERVRTLYKHIKHKTHWYHIAQKYNIDFTKNDYSKEQASVNKLFTKRFEELEERKKAS